MARIAFEEGYGKTLELRWVGMDQLGAHVDISTAKSRIVLERDSGPRQERARDR